MKELMIFKLQQIVEFRISEKRQKGIRKEASACEKSKYESPHSDQFSELDLRKI